MPIREDTNLFLGTAVAGVMETNIYAYDLDIQTQSTELHISLKFYEKKN